MVWLTQDKALCEDALARVGEYTRRLTNARRELRRTFYELYGGEAVGLTVADLFVKFRGDMSRGMLEVEGDDLCSPTGCVDLEHLYKTLYEYHRTVAERSKAVRHVIDNCIGVTPSTCRIETSAFTGLAKKLMDLGVDPKRVTAHLKEMALKKDRRLPEAVQTYIDFLVARGRLISCARREAGYVEKLEEI